MSECKGSSIGQRQKNTEAIIIKGPHDDMGNFKSGMAFQNYLELRGGKPDFIPFHQLPIGYGLPPGKRSDHRDGSLI